MGNIQSKSDDREFTAFPDLRKFTDEQLEEIYLCGDNLHMHTSRASAAKRLLDIRRAARDAAVPKDPIQQQIYIGNLYGQFTGVNSGTMVQDNNQEIMGALTALTEVIAEGKIADNDKQDALGDIQTIQAQVSKKSPSRAVIDAAFRSLQIVANMAQIASVAMPLMEKIQAFIQSLPNL